MLQVAALRVRYQSARAGKLIQLCTKINAEFDFLSPKAKVKVLRVTSRLSSPPETIPSQLLCPQLHSQKATRKQLRRTRHVDVACSLTSTLHLCLLKAYCLKEGLMIMMLAFGGMLPQVWVQLMLMMLGFDVSMGR